MFVFESTKRRTHAPYLALVSNSAVCLGVGVLWVFAAVRNDVVEERVVDAVVLVETRCFRVVD